MYAKLFARIVFEAAQKMITIILTAISKRLNLK